ncbi:hypothetical protein V8G54_013600, partial [Vigna mungo]
VLKAHHGPFPFQQVDLPIATHRNSPLISPIGILDSKWDNSTSPPTELVLVQWMGLTPEDTTREIWNELCDTYHLEDKVILSGNSNDSNSSPQEDYNNTIRPNGKSNSNITSRTRRLPKYLIDYKL